MIPKHPSEQILSELPELKHCGIALVEFVEALAHSKEWSLSSNRWIMKSNFVTFRVQPRVRAIRATLRGRTREFNLFPELTLERGRAGAYTEFAFKEPKQLAAAAFYIHRAHELYERGGSRRKSKQVIQEV